MKKTGPFQKFTNGCVSIVQKFLPDAFIFCIILTIAVYIFALINGMGSGAGPMDVVLWWGNSIWSLLAFSMQMALVLVLGNAMASAPPVKRLLDKIAKMPKTPAQGIILTTIVGTVASWLNWGFGLVVGALLAKAIAKELKGVDYRLLIASAYSGFVVWHAGLSGSIPLTVAAVDEAVTTATGGALTESIAISRTILSPWNLAICAVILILMPIVNAKMHPSADKVVTIDPSLLVEEEVTVRKASTPAEHLEDCKPLSWLIVLISVVYLVHYFMNNGFNLSLNIVNLIFLALGLLLNGTPLNYVNAIMDAAKGAGGIILQFPFYAGIMGMMTGKLADVAGATSLAGVISNFFVSISTQVTFPVWTFLSAGVVNFFVPSGGGQWAVQAPIVLPSSVQIGVDPALSCMGIAWGDAWTNLLQPFWALPALGIAGLGARDIMGYCVVDLLLTGVIIVIGFIIAGTVMA